MKKVSLLALCILGLLSPTWSQQGPAAIEYLAYATTGGNTPWALQPDPTVQTNFESPILLSFDVPPSQKSPAVFIDLWGQYVLSWAPNPVRICTPLIYYRITCSAIPNIEFSQGYSVPPTISETNLAGDYSYPTGARVRHKGFYRTALRKDKNLLFPSELNSRPWR